MTNPTSSVPSPVRVLFFARLREKMGFAEATLDIESTTSLAELQARLTAAYPQFATLPQPVLAAVNQEFAVDQQLVHAGDEVAFFPPVTGG